MARQHAQEQQVDSISPALEQNLNWYLRKHLCSPPVVLANMAAVKNAY